MNKLPDVKKIETIFLPKRFVFIISLISLFIVIILVRLIYLQFIDSSFLQNEGDRRVVRYDTVFANRGVITDRNNQALAVSTPVMAVWSNSKMLSLDDPDQLAQLAILLNMSYEDLLLLIETKKNAPFFYIKRQLTPSIGNEIAKLKIPGIYLQREYKRYYPSGEIISPVLGMTNIDDYGQFGLELQHNSWLSGKQGQHKFIKDLLGHTIEQPEIISSAMPGHTLTLSIDLRLQYIAYRALCDAITKNEAESASIIMMNPQNGEILAMANYPSFNPNNRSDYSHSSAKNRAIVDQFEPGSIMKLATLSAALLSGRFTLETQIDTTPGSMCIDGHIVKDVSKHGIISVADVLIKSSNIGATKIAFEIGQNAMIDILHRLGFSQPTGVGFPGEALGTVPYMFPLLKKIELSNLSYGYHASSTPLQLLRAFSVIANGGVLYPATLIKRHKPLKGERVLPEWIADSVRQVAEKVVSQGTGRRAQVPGYTVAGKTGTAHKISEQGYDKKKYIASFLGMMPAQKPELIALVLFNGIRKGSYYGGVVAAPVFAQVMGQAARILGLQEVSKAAF